MTSQYRYDSRRERAKCVAAAAYPPWVTLEPHCTKEVQGSSTSVGDPNTLVSARTNTGLPIRISLSLAAPPEGSRVCVQLPSGVEVSYSLVLAADGDSVLLQVARIASGRTDHFVYNAGDAAAGPPLRPPSLSLLPPYVLTGEKGDRRMFLDSHGTGILRRGADEFVVAELNMEYEEETGGEQMPRLEAELSLLRSGCGEWRVVKRPPIRHCNGGTAFVNIYPRCCCGGAGHSKCTRSRHAYTVRTWTLRMDHMAWVMDATQLLATTIAAAGSGLSWRSQWI